MISPQLENGYMRVANEIIDAVAAAGLNGTQMSIILCVWRYTYGFNRKSCQLSESFIARFTGTSGRNLRRQLSELIDNNVIIVEKAADFNAPRILSFNKHYDEWRKYAVGEVTEVSPPNEHVYENGGEEEAFSGEGANLSSPDKNGHRGGGQIDPPGEDILTPSGEDNLTPSGEDILTPQEIQYKDKYKDIYPRAASIEELFAKFWGSYPRKAGKADAMRAFKKLKPDESLFAAMTAALERQRQSEQWQGSNGQFIPYPASWLNGRRWEDELPDTDAGPKYNFLN